MTSSQNDSSESELWQNYRAPLTDRQLLHFYGLAEIVNEEEFDENSTNEGGDGATDIETETASSEDAPSSSKGKKRGRPPAKKQQQQQKKEQKKKIYTMMVEVVVDKIVRRDEENSEFEVKFRPLPNQMVPIERMERDYPDLVNAFEQAKKTNNKRKQDSDFEVSLDEPPKAKGIRSSQRHSPKKQLNLTPVRRSGRVPKLTNFFLVESSKHFETVEGGTRKAAPKKGVGKKPAGRGLPPKKSAKLQGQQKDTSDNESAEADEEEEEEKKARAKDDPGASSSSIAAANEKNKVPARRTRSHK